MEQLVRSFIKKHELLKTDSRVLVGVSGGPDSMALLHLLKKLRQEYVLDLHVLSCDHKLRGEDSKEDFAYVEAVCREWEIPFHGRAFDTAAEAKRERVSVEVAARNLRYRFFTEKMHELNGDYLALGHHGDDQVETLLMKLVRTASSSAFSGIPVTRPIGDGTLIRPLLAVTKNEIEAYCRENSINPRLDATNFEALHTRNYYRRKVVPLLKEKNENIHRTAQHLSETLAEDEIYLQNAAQKVLKESAVFDDEKRQVILEINSFKKHDHPLQRRAFHLILNYLYETLPDYLSYVHEAQFLELIGESRGSQQIDFPQGLRLNRAYNKLTIYFQSSQSAPKPIHKPLTIPGATYLPDGSVIRTTYTAAKGKETPDSFYFPASCAKFPLYVRTRSDGDRMSWKGLAGTKKLKDIFIDEKIPRERRDTWPLVTDKDGEILWLIGLRKGKLNEEHGEQFVYIRYEKGNQ